MGNSIPTKNKCHFCLRKLPINKLTIDDTASDNNYQICNLCLNTKKRLIKNFVSQYRKYPSNGEIYVIECELRDILKGFSLSELDKIDFKDIV